MELTEIATRLLKNPRRYRKVKSVYKDHLKKVGPRSWVLRLDVLPPNLRREMERP
jgi:hypothetical protein